MMTPFDKREHEFARELYRDSTPAGGREWFDDDCWTNCLCKARKILSPRTEHANDAIAYLHPKRPR